MLEEFIYKLDLFLIKWLLINYNHKYLHILMILLKKKKYLMVKLDLD